MGWLKTVDQYYYGSNDTIKWANAGVQYILDTVVPQLVIDPRKRFIFVETAYFWRWWGEQEDPMKTTVRKLVKNGQLEFILAWVIKYVVMIHNLYGLKIKTPEKTNVLGLSWDILVVKLKGYPRMTQNES